MVNYKDNLLEKITNIAHQIDDFHAYANENFLVESDYMNIGVLLDFIPRMYLIFDKEDLTLDPDGDLKFLLTGWYAESDGFTYSPRLKAETPETIEFLNNLEKKEGMPFWGFEQGQEECVADRCLLSRNATEYLRKIFHLKRNHFTNWQNP